MSFFQIHSDQMPFRCDYCQRLFKHKRSRDRHIKLHTGDKRYKCAHCESAFSRSDHLKIHMKTHDHMKPFQCKICNRGYNTAAALTSHMQNHKRNNATPTGNGVKSPNEKLGSNASNCTSSSKGVKDEASKLSPNCSQKGKESIDGLSPRSNNRDDVEQDGKGRCAESDEEERCSSRDRRGKDEQRGCGKTQDVNSDGLTNGANLTRNPSGGQEHQQHQQPQQQQQQVTCGLCGNKCTHLDIHFRECHLQHLLFAGLLHNSFYHGNLPSWSPLMPPPPVPLTHLNEVSSSVQPGLTNGRIVSPNSPKKPKIISSYNGLSSVPSSSPLHHLPLPLLCNQCSPSPSFPDFESFRVHLKAHLMASQTPLSSILPLSHHQCPYCGDVVTTDFETHIVNSHFGTVETQYGCETCSKMFEKPEELQKHLMDIHAHHLYQCSLCRDMFDSKVSIQVHFACKHSNECKLYKCCICGELWNNERDFKIHIKLSHLQTHLPPPPPPPPSHSPSQQHPTFPTAFHLFGSKAFFKCQYCSEEFNIEFLLEKHLETQHPNQLEQQRKVNEDNRREMVHQTPTPKSSKPGGKPVGGSTRSSDSLPERLSRCGSDFDLHLKSHQNTKFNGHKSVPVTNSKSTTKCNICDEVCESLTDLTDHKTKKHCIFGCSSSGSRNGNSSQADDDKSRASKT